MIFHFHFALILFLEYIFFFIIEVKRKKSIIGRETSQMPRVDIPMKLFGRSLKNCHGVKRHSRVVFEKLEFNVRFSTCFKISFKAPKVY